MPELTDESENAEIYARYLGEGVRYLAGIPARDLTRAEWDALSEQDRDRARDVKPALYAFADARISRQRKGG